MMIAAILFHVKQNSPTWRADPGPRNELMIGS